ncbi:DUF6600 domain-containing protein [Verrucomicrobiota bacterium sgz303538]
MKLRLAPFAIALVLSACQRGPNPADLEAERRRGEQMRELDQKIAQLQDLERQTSERKVAESDRKAAESERERQRLEVERQKLLREREQLADARKAAEEKASSAERRADETARRADRERQERTIDLFYTALEPHGEWLEVGQYGYVWQPSEASDPRWRPYTDGRWVFSDYGWTWKSNEPFGWAVYHYGRWTRVKGLGWIWVPGTEWGPGWVSWRRSDRFVGWAPLPPDAWSRSGFNGAVDSYYDIGPSAYTFVPVQEIGQASYVGRVVEPAQNVTIVNQTVNVTNITYTNVQNNTVVFNGGPELAEVNAKATQKVPRLKVERVTDVRSPSELGRAEQRGDTLIMAAPKIAAQKVETKPVRVKEQVKAPVLDRGWADVEKRSADETRARITKEARETEDQQRKTAPVQPPQTPRVSATPPETPQKTAQPKTNQEKPASPATPRPETSSAVPAQKPIPRGEQPVPRREQEGAVPPRATPEARKPASVDSQGKPGAPEPSAASTPAPNIRGNRLARPTPGRGVEKTATPASPDLPQGPNSKPDQRAARPSQSQPVDAAPAAPASPAPAASNPNALPAGDNAVGATPNRRPPIAKRPRPATAATPEPMLSPVETPATSPSAATPDAKPGGKKKQERDAAAAERR